MTRVATRRGAYRRGGRVANDPSRSATRGRRGVGREGARAYPRRSRRRGWDSSRGCSCTRTRRRSPRRGTPWRARCGCERGCSPRSSWREAASCRRFGRPRGGRPRSGARARAGGLAGGAANGQRKKARGPSWDKGAPGSATTPERARSLGKEPETGRRDPAIRARSERGGGRRRRRRGRALPRLSRLRRGARPWVWRRARRDRRKRREMADERSLAPRASFIRPRADLRPRSRDFPNDGTGGLDRRRLGSRRERLSPNADRNDARRSIEPNEPPDSSSSSSEGSPPRCGTRVHH